MIRNVRGFYAAGTVIVVVAGGLLISQILGDAKPGSLLKPADNAVVGLGASVYAEHCASCHGNSLEGQPDWKNPGPDGLMPAPPHNEHGHTWHHTDAVLFRITKFGLASFPNMNTYETSMPVFKDTLSDQEIIAALSYIKSRWPMPMQKLHDQNNARSAEAE